MDDNVFTQYVKEERNIIGVIKRFKRSAVGSNYRWVHKNVERLNLDISHWKKNLNNPRPIRKHSNIDLFVENSDSDRSVIRKRIIKDSLFDYKCIECGISEWRGKKLGLVLDHINGINNDHRLENLRWLCPNCNSLTDTFAGRNKSKEK